MQEERWKDQWNFNEHNYQRQWKTDQRIMARSLLDLTLKHILIGEDCSTSASCNEWINNSISLTCLISRVGRTNKGDIGYFGGVFCICHHFHLLQDHIISENRWRELKNEVPRCFWFGTTLATEKYMQEDESVWCLWLCDELFLGRHWFIGSIAL